MGKNTLIYEMSYSIFIFFFSFFLLGILAIQYVQQTISNETFFVIYFAFGVIGCIGSLIAIIMHWIVKARDNQIASVFTLTDSNRILRPLSNPYARALLLIGLLVFTIAGVTILGSFVGSPNPYTSETLSKSVLDNHSLWLNVFNISAYAGLYEELVIYLMISIMIGATMLIGGTINKKLKNNPLLFYPAMIVSVTIGTFLFTLAHKQAYGMNQEAYFGAFIFEFIMQLSNQLGGIFISWIPHMIHNGFVVFSTQTAFAIGGTALFGLLFWRYRK